MAEDQMNDSGGSPWVHFVGGSAPYREAVLTGYRRPNSASGESVEGLIGVLGVNLRIVFCDSEDNRTAVKAAAVDPTMCVIAIVPDLDLAAFRWALLNGAAGAVWVDTPISQLVEATWAALRHEMLLPADVVRALASGEPLGGDVADLDPVSLTILRGLARGDSARKLATEIGCTERTVQRRIVNLCVSLGATTPSQAVYVASRRGLQI